jgi:hypothetical protein
VKIAKSPFRFLKMRMQASMALLKETSEAQRKSQRKQLKGSKERIG